MKNIITERFAVVGLFVIISLMIIFHLLILLNAIPFGVVWGGRLANQSQILIFEIISITLNVLMLTVVAAKGRIVKVSISPALIHAALWVMLVIFLLNTVGNLLSVNNFEQMVFTPVTILLSIFCPRLVAIAKKHR